MAKKTKAETVEPVEPKKTYTWSVFKIGKKQSLVGYVDAPDEQSAITAAAEMYQVPAALRSRLIARRGR